MAFDSTSTLLATGGADATVKVWDVVREYCTNNLRQHRGVVRLQLYDSLNVNCECLFAAVPVCANDSDNISCYYLPCLLEKSLEMVDFSIKNSRPSKVLESPWTCAIFDNDSFL